VTDHIQNWFDTLRERHRATVPVRIEVVGQVNNHGDPNWTKVVARIVVEPADAFEVVDEVPDRDELSGFPYADRITTGLLSILLTAHYSPILNVRVTIKDLKIDPIEASLAAFEMAGRDAGRKIVEAMKQHRP
jgi:hypothetical protein